MNAPWLINPAMLGLFCQQNAWIKSGASVDMDFANNRYWGGPLAALTSTTRASPATTYAQNSAGLLLPFAANVPRITDLGLLVEESRTNYYYPNPPNGTASGGLTVTTNYAAAPDGTLTASRYVWLVGASPFDLGTAAITNVAGGTYTTTAYIEANTAPSTIAVFNGRQDQSSGAWFSFNFQTLTGSTVTLNGSGNTVTGASGSATLVGNYYRLQVTATHSQANAAFFRGGIATANGNPTTTAGDINLWGVQLELGASQTSLIPTTAAAVTRDADTIATLGALQTALAGAQGSVFAYGSSGNSVGNPRIIGGVGSVALLNTQGISSGGSSAAQMFNGSTALQTANGVDTTIPQKMASSWSASGRSVVIAGGTVATDLLATGDTSSSVIGTQSGTVQAWDGFIQRIAVWNSRLADATLKALTT